MIRGVGQDSALAKAAIEAALRTVQSGSQRVERAAAEVGPLDVGAAKPPGFAEVLKGGVAQAGEAARASEQLPLDMLAGKVGDFHEVAATLKQSELMFKFSLEVRNKLIEAYRETMRMTV
jgi:flagellar hook-basal body complex protein FliE